MILVKKILVQIIDFLVYSNLFISIAAFVFTLQTALVFDSALPASIFFAWTNFVATFILYNFQRIYESTKEPKSERMLWYDRNKKILFTLMLVFASLYFNFFKDHYDKFIEGLIAYVPISILSIAYFMPPFNLRKLPVLKIFIIGFVWLFSSSVIPLMYEDHTFVCLKNIGSKELEYIIAQFLFISALCIPFDIKDLENDRQSSVRTLPVHFGISKAKKIGVVLFLLYIILANDGAQFIAYLIPGLLGAILTMYSHDKKHRHYFYVLIDGLIILQFVLFFFLVQRG